MDMASALIAKHHPQPRYQQQIQNLLAKPQQTQRLGRWLGRYQRWGLQRLMRATGLLSLTGLSKSDNLLPKRLPKIAHSPEQPEYSPAVGEQVGIVALFTGCVSSIFDREALDASRLLLNRLGYGVYTPVGQTCCGAMHQHSGQPDKAAELAQTNLAVFKELGNTLNVEAIVHTSTGCTSFLQEYNQLFSSESFSNKVQDINQFLLNVSWPSGLAIRPLPKRVAIHEPCSARNVLRVADKAYRLLEAIPEIECVPLPDNAQCCGAAGSQLLSPSESSRLLRNKKLDALIHLKTELNTNTDIDTNVDGNIDTLVTTNIGCALHLAAGLREHGQNVEVLHPVTLLTRQLAPEITAQDDSKVMQTCTSSQASARVLS